MSEILVNNFKVPNWASKPPPGMHLDVMKDGKLVQKLMMDEKSCYFFGRNRQLCDFNVDHQSCSRVHAALMWHKNLNRAFIVDLGSIHGTFIGRIRMDPERPQQVPIDSEIHFGASTRIYIIRERPTPVYSLNSSEPMQSALKESDLSIAGQQNLPHTAIELDNLTQFNTAHNRRITSIINDMPPTPSSKLVYTRRRKNNVHFNDADEIINPEDIDPSVGRFRNLVQETFIPNKHGKDSHEGADLGVAAPKDTSSVYEQPPSTPTNITRQSSASLASFNLAAKLGLPMPNLAPDIDIEPLLPSQMLLAASRRRSVSQSSGISMTAEDILGGDSGSAKMGVKRSAADGVAKAPEKQQSSEPKKKKYAKEAWPGKRPGFLVGPVA